MLDARIQQGQVRVLAQNDGFLLALVPVVVAPGLHPARLYEEVQPVRIGQLDGFWPWFGLGAGKVGQHGGAVSAVGKVAPG